MMRNKVFRLAGMALLMLVPLSGGWTLGAPSTLTVDQAVDAAILNNLGVKSAAVQERIKKRASDFSFNKFYPSVSGSATALRLNQVTDEVVPVGASTATSFGPLYDNVLSYAPDAQNLTLELTIKEVFSPAYIELMNQAALDYQASAIDRGKAEKQIASTVKKYFYQLIVQDEAIALTQARLDNANERLRQAKVAFELGQGTELNYMYALSNVEGLVPDLRSMKTNRAQGLTSFEEILGFDKRDDMQLVGSLEDDQIVGADKLAIDGMRFDVASAQLSVKQLKSAIMLEDMTLLPNLVFQYTADPTLNGPENRDVFKSDNWAQSSGALSVTLSWDVSGLLPGSDLQVKRANLKDQLTLALESASTATINALHDEDNQRRLIADSHAKIENLKNAVSASKRAYELTDASYNAGVGRYLDLQSAEISLQSSQIQLLNERFNLLSLIYDLEAKYNVVR